MASISDNNFQSDLRTLSQIKQSCESGSLYSYQIRQVENIMTKHGVSGSTDLQSNWILSRFYTSQKNINNVKEIDIIVEHISSVLPDDCDSRYQESPAVVKTSNIFYRAFCWLLGISKSNYVLIPSQEQTNITSLIPKHLEGNKEIFNILSSLPVKLSSTEIKFLEDVFTINPKSLINTLSEEVLIIQRDHLNQCLVNLPQDSTNFERVSLLLICLGFDDAIVTIKSKLREGINPFSSLELDQIKNLLPKEIKRAYELASTIISDIKFRDAELKHSEITSLMDKIISSKDILANPTIPSKTEDEHGKPLRVNFWAKAAAIYAKPPGNGTIDQLILHNNALIEATEFVLKNDVSNKEHYKDIDENLSKLTQALGAKLEKSKNESSDISEEIKNDMKKIHQLLKKCSFRCVDFPTYLKIYSIEKIMEETLNPNREEDYINSIKIQVFLSESPRICINLSIPPLLAQLVEKIQQRLADVITEDSIKEFEEQVKDLPMTPLLATYINDHIKFLEENVEAVKELLLEIKNASSCLKNALQKISGSKQQLDISKIDKFISDVSIYGNLDQLKIIKDLLLAKSKAFEQLHSRNKTFVPHKHLPEIIDTMIKGFNESLRSLDKAIASLDRHPSVDKKIIPKAILNSNHNSTHENENSKSVIDRTTKDTDKQSGKFSPITITHEISDEKIMPQVLLPIS